MKARLVRIGNPRGVRLPKPLILEVGLSEDVELRVQQGAIVVARAAFPRSGWADAGEGRRDDLPPARPESGGCETGRGVPLREGGWLAGQGVRPDIRENTSRKHHGAPSLCRRLACRTRGRMRISEPPAACRGAGADGVA